MSAGDLGVAAAAATPGDPFTAEGPQRGPLPADEPPPRPAPTRVVFDALPDAPRPWDRCSDDDARPEAVPDCCGGCTPNWNRGGGVAVAAGEDPGVTVLAAGTGVAAVAAAEPEAFPSVVPSPVSRGRPPFAAGGASPRSLPPFAMPALSRCSPAPVAACRNLPRRGWLGSEFSLLAMFGREEVNAAAAARRAAAGLPGARCPGSAWAWPLMVRLLSRASSSSPRTGPWFA